MSALTNKPMLEAPTKGAISPSLRKSATNPVFKPDFSRSLRMHPVVAAVVGSVVLAALIGYALLLKPMYEADSLVYLAPGAAKILDDGSGGLFDSTRYDSYLQQQIQTASRLDILTAAVRTLPVGVWRGAGEPERSAAERLQHALKIERVLNSYQLSFTLQGPSPEHTAQTLNAVVAAYLTAGRKDELTTADQRAEILGEEKGRIIRELAAARAEQSSLSTSLGMANPGLESSNPYDAELSGLRAELASAREAHDVAAAQLASVSGAGVQTSQGLTAAADELIGSDTGLSSMKSTISQRRAVLSGQMAGLTPENPIYKQDAAELASLDRSLETMTTQVRDKAERRLQDKLRTDLARTGDVEARLNSQLAQETGAATSASPKLQRASELTADIDRLMKRYATVDDALRGVQLETNGPGTAHLVLAASAPSVPVPSRRKLLLLAAIPLALLFGAFAAVLARKRDPRVYTGRDIEDLLGFTPIAVLPASGEVASSVMAEFILRLAGGIEGAYRVSGARTFVLAPAGVHCDLTVLLEPLALQLEKLGLAVCSMTAREMMNPAATPAPESLGPAERRREGVVAGHLEAMMRRYDLLFIDAPALLTSAETEYLVRCTDATILVATSGVTSRGELLQAALLLERLQVRGVGAVLKGLELRFADASFRRSIVDLEARDTTAAKHWKRERVEAEPISAITAAKMQSALIEEQRPEVSTMNETTAAPPESLRVGPLPVAEVREEVVSVHDEAPADSVSEWKPVGAVEVAALKERPAGGKERERSAQAAAVDVPAEVPVQAQVDLPIGAPVAQTEVFAGAPERAKPMHRSMPLRRLAENPERESSWLNRLLVPEATPGVSSLPDEKDEVATEVAPEETAMAGYAAGVPETLDLPPVVEESSPAMAEAVEAGESVNPNVEELVSTDVAEPLVRQVAADVEAASTEVGETHVEEAEAISSVDVVDHAFAEENASERADTSREVMAPATAEEVEVAALAEEDALLIEAKEMQSPAASGEVLPADAVASQDVTLAEGKDSEVPVAAALPETPDMNAEFTTAVQEPISATPERVPVAAEPERQPMSTSSMPRNREPLRVARWEGADMPSRVEVTPWRDRRVSGPNSAFSSTERRFNWNTVDATPSGSEWPVAPARRLLETRSVSALPERPVEPSPERPRLVQADEKSVTAGRLTRQWALLSRFGALDAAKGERDGGEHGEDAGSRAARGSRRG